GTPRVAGGRGVAGGARHLDLAAGRADPARRGASGRSHAAADSSDHFPPFASPPAADERKRGGGGHLAFSCVAWEGLTFQVFPRYAELFKDLMERADLYFGRVSRDRRAPAAEAQLCVPLPFRDLDFPAAPAGKPAQAVQELARLHRQRSGESARRPNLKSDKNVRHLGLGGNPSN